MVKDIGKFYNHSQYQLSTSSLKAPVSLSSEPQTSSVIELTTTSVPSAKYKHQNNSVLYSQNIIQNDTTITNNDNIHDGRILLKESILTDYQCMPSARTMECSGRNVLYCMCICSHVNSLESIDTYV